ncbi:MAG TPA: hydrogenase maturation protease [Candidatus Sulfotelmatobacter sp.]|nr:hydrogenase maturation protease [Candidatus Sulfotelmatobacter sp.]
MAPRVQIVAYGNPLRSDDGVAWRIADALTGKYSAEEVEIVTLHQLGPELAESIRRTECVIFIDAAAGPGRPGDVRIAEVPRSSDAPGFCHAVSPSHVLTMAAQLYGAQPRAFSTTIVGLCFDHGESLSKPVQAAIPVLIERIEELLHNLSTTKDTKLH